MKKYFNRDFIIKIFMIFLIIQPILDIYILFDENVVNFFKFSPSTIIRMIFIGLLCLLALFTIKWNKKHLWLIGYIILVLSYTILHHINALKFNSGVPGNYYYSIISELFYIIRMMLPLIIVFISYNFEFTKKNLEKTIQYLVILISGSIVLTNLLEISLTSYTNEIISANIIDWFFLSERSYRSLASKGFFTFANQIAALELLITPIMFYFTNINPSKKNIILSIIQLLAVFMIGTKVATLGFLAILIIMFIMYIFFTLIKKEIVFSKKIIINYIILFTISFCLLPVCPMLGRSQTSDAISEEFEEEKTCKLITFDYENTNEYSVIEKEINVSKDDECKTTSEFEKEKINFVNNQLKLSDDKQKFLNSFIEKEYDNFRINKRFVIQSYPYKYNPDFWFEIMQLPLEQRLNYRFIEEEMLKEVKRYNNNKYDNYFGITYTRMSNIFNLERDFLSHYYSLGILGFILFLLPYILIILVSIVVMLIKFKTKLTLFNCSLLLGIGLVVCSAFYSGNVMDGLIVTLIFGFICGQLLKSLFKKDIISNKKVSIIMPTYNDSDTILETLDSVKNQTNKNWELIIVDDGSTDNTKYVVNNYIKKNKLKEKIKYIYQENSDQLNAIKNGMNYINGDYVLILHSDDLLGSKKTLENINYSFNNYDCDAIFGDLIIINENSKKTGIQKVNDYYQKNSIPPLQLLWLGRNLYLDTAVFKKDIFKKYVLNNYLDWNMPFWLCYNKSVHMLNVLKVPFSLIRYRVHSGNYINNELGKLNVINGELRTATNLLAYYDIPKYELQYKIFRFINKIGIRYIPYYKNKESNDKYSILKFIINKRFNNYEDNIFINSLLNFYKYYSDRTISIKIDESNLYLGSDMRKFNKQILSNDLPDMYIEVFKEMDKGFNKILVKTKEEEENALILTKFLCIYPFVKIEKE